MNRQIEQSIRPECLTPFNDNWPTPTGNEIAEVLRLAGFSGSMAAKAVGLKKNGSRTVRKWIGEEAEIPYAVWALLCHFAGLGQIWINSKSQPQAEDD